MKCPGLAPPPKKIVYWAYTALYIGSAITIPIKTEKIWSIFLWKKLFQQQKREIDLKTFPQK